MVRLIQLILLCCICFSCREGSDIMPPRELTSQPIITACTQTIFLETAAKTSTKIKFSTSKSWTIMMNNSKTEVAWISLDKTFGEAGDAEIVATITEPNPSSLKQREAYIKVVSDTAYRIVSIIQPPRPTTDIAVTDVSMDKSDLKLVVGTKGALIATVIPNNATNRAVEWSSSDTSIASVNNSGIVSGVRNGTAVITATTVDADRVSTCKVTVVTTPESGGQINDWD